MAYPQLRTQPVMSWTAAVPPAGYIPHGHPGGYPGLRQLTTAPALAPLRPVYREPFPVSGSSVALGMLVAGLWMALTAAQTSSLRAYALVTMIAGVVAWAVAAVLCRFGNRGTAAGVAMASAVGIAVATVVVVVRWASSGWPLW